MKRVFLSALIAIGAVAAIFQTLSGSDAARTQHLLASGARPIVEMSAAPRPSVPSETKDPQSDEFYAQREKNASQEIRQQLEQFRREIRKNNWSYAVGYTTAMDRSMDELAGTRIPDDLADQYRRKNALLSRRRN